MCISVCVLNHKLGTSACFTDRGAHFQGRLWPRRSSATVRTAVGEILSRPDTSWVSKSQWFSWPQSIVRLQTHFNQDVVFSCFFLFSVVSTNPTNSILASCVIFHHMFARFFRGTCRRSNSTIPMPYRMRSPPWKLRCTAPAPTRQQASNDACRPWRRHSVGMGGPWWR